MNSEKLKEVAKNVKTSQDGKQRAKCAGCVCGHAEKHHVKPKSVEENSCLYCENETAWCEKFEFWRVK